MMYIKEKHGELLNETTYIVSKILAGVLTAKRDRRSRVCRDEYNRSTPFEGFMIFAVRDIFLIRMMQRTQSWLHTPVTPSAGF